MWYATDPVRVIVESGPDNPWADWMTLVGVIVGAILGGAAQAWAGWLNNRHERRVALGDMQYAAYRDMIRIAKNLDFKITYYADCIDAWRGAATPAERSVALEGLDGAAEALNVTVQEWGDYYAPTVLFGSDAMCNALADMSDALATVADEGREGDTDVMRAQARAINERYRRMIVATRKELGVDKYLPARDAFINSED
ncbi:hypothetical protein OMK64_13180 [Cellulomonas fimi]|uniref:hypothetical protein n=1 Tax=Cellulomonas fimi TaxID=1708 RepID=UPI00234D2C65|nr:hypothetical protein [Cellulomonas fimi]MDC7122487.1 hypothetical protein [Cellulomonas fimi]